MLIINIIIELKFDNSVKALVGEEFGKEVYNTQIRDKIRMGEEITIKFQDTIERVASSFTQGLFSELVEKLGVIGVRENIKINSTHKEMVEKMYRDISIS